MNSIQDCINRSERLHRHTRTLGYNSSSLRDAWKAGERILNGAPLSAVLPRLLLLLGLATAFAATEIYVGKLFGDAERQAGLAEAANIEAAARGEQEKELAAARGVKQGEIAKAESLASAEIKDAENKSKVALAQAKLFENSTSYLREVWKDAAALAEDERKLKSGEITTLQFEFRQRAAFKRAEQAAERALANASIGGIRRTMGPRKDTTP